jgi:hypothetical protein
LPGLYALDFAAHALAVGIVGVFLPLTAATPRSSHPVFGIRNPNCISIYAEWLNSDTKRKLNDYYERRAYNPSSISFRAPPEALDVSVAESLGSEPNSKRGKPGPTPQLQLRFDQIRRLPRKEQEFVLRFIDTVLEKAQKA